MIEYITANWADIATGIAASIGVASVIVKLTPTPKDDAILGKIKAFISRFIALNPK